jgi:hypothetical protein
MDGRLRRTKEALRVFAEQPNVFAPEIREAILANRVILGMTPYDVHLAVGAFCFRVMADPRHWPDGANPWDVMWAQTSHPDASEILLVFDSATQQSGQSQPGLRRYQVFIRDGKAQSIEVLPQKAIVEAVPEQDELAASAAWLEQAQAQVGAAKAGAASQASQASTANDSEATIQRPASSLHGMDATVPGNMSSFFEGSDATIMQPAFKPPAAKPALDAMADSADATVIQPAFKMPPSAGSGQ